MSKDLTIPPAQTLNELQEMLNVRLEEIGDDLSKTLTIKDGVVDARGSRLANIGSPKVSTDAAPLHATEGRRGAVGDSRLGRRIGSQVAIDPNAPDQLETGDWGLSLGPTQADAQTGVQSQRIDVTITAKPEGATHFYIWVASPPNTAPKWDADPYAVAVAETGNTVVEFWKPRDSVARTYQVAVTVNNAVVSIMPQIGVTVIKSITVPAIAPALEPVWWDIVAESNIVAGAKYGRYVITGSLPADVNRDFLRVERRFTQIGWNEPKSAWMLAFGPPTLPFSQLQFEWKWPANEYTEWRLGVVNHAGHVTWSGFIKQIHLDGGNTVDGAAVTNIPAASLASGIQPVGIVTATANGNGELIISKTQEVVYNTTDQKTYRWVTDRYRRRLGAGDLEADTVTAGVVAAGAIGTTQLAAAEILIGAGGGKPTRFRVNDAFGNMIAFLGDNQDGFVGGWFQRARIGGTYGSPVIDASSVGMSITNAALTVAATGGFNPTTITLNPTTGFTATGQFSVPVQIGDPTQSTVWPVIVGSGNQYIGLGGGLIYGYTDFNNTRGFSMFNSSGEPVVNVFNGSVDLRMVAGLSAARLTSANSGSYIHFSGANSYADFREYRQNGAVRLDASGNLRWPNVYAESNPLSGLTATHWVPAYDASGNYRGKILIIP